MPDFSKLTTLLNKLYRLYGTRKNNAELDPEERALYEGVYNAIKVGQQLVINSGDESILHRLLKKQNDVYGKRVQQHPTDESKLTLEQREEKGAHMGYQMLYRVATNLNQIDVNERYVLQSPLVQLTMEKGD